MALFLLVDVANLYHRCKYVTSGDIEVKSSLGLHIILNSIKKIWNQFGADHIVFCMDKKSWRRSIYPQYKKHRELEREMKPIKEQEDDTYYFSVMEDFVTFVRDKTNVTVLQATLVEADDWVAYWISQHKEDNHIIISSDSDFYQLLATNVSIYDGIKNQLVTLTNITDENGNPVLDPKTNEPVESPNPEWELFEKIMRGDPSDNIMPAYPGVRKKSSKNKTGLLDAFNDRHDKGYLWNNLMLQTWNDHDGIEHRVIDCYELNKFLIDLSCQPDEVRELMEEGLLGALREDIKTQVGVWFMKFCSKYRLDNILKNPKPYSDFLSKEYNKDNSAFLRWQNIKAR